MELYWNDNGEVACIDHAPGIGTDTWHCEGWMLIPPPVLRELQTQHSIVLRCEHCPTKTGHCDYDHSGPFEVRRLPIDRHDRDKGAIILCRKHYEDERAFRRSNWPAQELQDPTPKWEDLEVYDEEAA